MKKVILFLMTFVSLVSFAGTTTTTTYDFSLDENESETGSWHYKKVTNAKTAIKNRDLAVGDKIVVEFTNSSVNYAVCNEKGTKILTGSHSETGSYNSEYQYYTSSSSTIKFKITSDLLSEIESNGLRIEYEGSNLISAAYVERTTYNDGTTDPKTLTLGSTTKVNESTTWNYNEVLGISLIGLYDEVKFSFTANGTTGESATNQYAICDAGGTKLVKYSDSQDWFECSSGTNSYSLKITANILANIKAGGLRFEYNTGIEESSIKVELIKYDPSTAKVGEKLSVNKRLDSEGNPFDGTDVSETEEVNTWYNLYRVNLPSDIAVGDTIRVYVKPLSKQVDLGGTTVTDVLRDGMYAFLKTNTDGNPALMGGSDKFSIAGWDYYQFVYTNEISNSINGNCLIIGGYNYKMDGVYLMRHSDTQAEKQVNENKPKVLARLTEAGLYVNNKNGVDGDGTVIDNETKLPGATGDGEWKNYQIKTKPIFSRISNNTQNLMVRIYTDGAHNVSLKDASNASYLIDYSSGVHAVYGSTGEHTVDGSTVYYKDVPVMDYIWKNDGNKSITGIVYNKHTLITQNDDEVFNVGVQSGTISKIEIVESTVKNNVSGQVTYKRTLQDNIYKPIALPYNLTYGQTKAVFGDGVKVMDLKDGRFVKSEKNTVEKKEISYQIYINFHPIGWYKDENGNDQTTSYNDDDAYMIANYPYIIELGSGTKSEFKIPVVAELRDFTTYTAYVKAADFTYVGFDPNVKVTDINENSDTKGQAVVEETYWRTLFAKDYMAFTSTAPYFDVTTAGNGESDQIDLYGDKQTSYKTVSLTRGEDDPFYSQAGAYRHVYYFYGGSLWRAEETKYFHSGLGFVELSSIFNEIAGGETKYIPTEVTENANTTVKLQYAYDEDMPTAIKGIVETGTVQSHKAARRSRTGVFTINGQRINSSGSTEGLAKGFYIVNGKKVVIR